MSAVVHPASENPRLRIHRLVALLVERQRLADGIAAEARHQMNPAEGAIDTAFARIACECPDPCACPAGGAL
jgi:hypothetical protein